MSFRNDVVKLLWDHFEDLEFVQFLPTYLGRCVEEHFPAHLSPQLLNSIEKSMKKWSVEVKQKFFHDHSTVNEDEFNQKSMELDSAVNALIDDFNFLLDSNNMDVSPSSDVTPPSMEVFSDKLPTKEWEKTGGNELKGLLT